MADYRLKFYLDNGDGVEVTETNKPEDLRDFIDPITFANFAIFDHVEGLNGCVAINMSHVTKIEVTQIDKRTD